MLNKKILRDIWKNKSQFITIFIMVFLAVFAFAGVHAYMDGMKESARLYYENQNLEDLWLAGENFTEEDLEDIKNIENVSNVERKLTVNANVVDSTKYISPINNEQIEDLVLECNFIETNNINKMYLIEGEEYSQDKSGVWLDYYLAKNIGISVGDELELSIDGTNFKEKVVGLVEVPDHVYFIKDDTAIFPTHTDYGFVYLSINECPFDYYVYPYAIVDVDDTSKLNDVKTEISDNIENVLAITTRDEDISYSGYEREAEEGETYSGVFSGLFVFIAILSVVTTMNRFIKKERTQIGTLKALGIKRRKITWMYVSYGIFISIIASILGVILGRLIIGNMFLSLEMSYYEIPYYDIITIPIVYYVAIGIVVVITAVTYLSCRKVLREPAAQAIRIEQPKIKVKENSFTTKKIFNKLSLSTKWNLRDIARSKARTLMAIVGIAGCTMLVVTALGMYDSMKSYLDWEFGTINNFDYKLSLSTDYTDNQYEELTEKYGDATSQNLGVEFKQDGEIIVKQLTVNDTNGLLQVTDHNRQPFDMEDGGLYITEKMASIYDLKVGDKIEWHIIGSDNWYESEIVGLNRDPQAQQFNCTKVFFDTLNEEYRVDSIYTNVNLNDTEELPGVNTIQTVQNLEDGMNSMLGMMYSLIFLLIVISAILSCVIIYNLGILSFGEKEYQFATLKVLGFKDKAIKGIFLKQNIWITIIAIIIALPLGNLMTDYIFKNAIGDTYDFSAMIKPETFIISAIGTFIVSIIVNKFLARKIKKIDMVSSLKGNE